MVGKGHAVAFTLTRNAREPGRSSNPVSEPVEAGGELNDACG